MSGTSITSKVLEFVAFAREGDWRFMFSVLLDEVVVFNLFFSVGGELKV